MTPESSEAVNRWLLTLMDDCPLHNLCCSTNVTSKTINTYLAQHGNVSALQSDHRNGMIPPHFLTMNPHAPADAILSLHPEQIIDTAFYIDDRNFSPLDYARKFNIRAFNALVTTLCNYRNAFITDGPVGQNRKERNTDMPRLLKRVRSNSDSFEEGQHIASIKTG